MSTAQRRSILVVEDEAVVAEDLQHRLGELGYEVAGWATTAADAMALTEDTEPDLVLMDIRIRGEADGIDAASEIRSRFDTPVVFVTALADSETLNRAKQVEPLGYVVKPFSDRDLETAIELALYKHEIDSRIREREDWLSTTLSSIGDAVIATDTEGRINYLNRVAEAITGWSAEEGMWRPVEEVVHAVEAGTDEPCPIPVAEAVSSGSTKRIVRDAELVSRDGSRMPISDAEAAISVAPIRDPRGEPRGTVMVFRDLSDKKEAERQRAELLDRLRASNNELDDERGFLEAMFEAVPSAVLVVDQGYRIRMINRHTRETFRIALPEGLDSQIGHVLQCPFAMENPGECGSLPECLVCQVRRPFLTAMEHGEMTLRQRCDLETRVDGQTRRLSLQISAAPLEYKDEPMVLVIVEDVTELSGLRELLKSEKAFAGIVGTSPKMLEIFDTIREIADVNVPVLILGESGTGKELVARAIHSEGNRAGGAFVPVNCGALPDGLLESELFGHVKGAFTGAVRDRKGRFELADGGTIFLDEIGDLSANMQVKLLRVLQESSFERVGGEKTVSVDVRVVCATNKDLAAAVEAGEFRDDLFYRLCVVPVSMPPLRERLVDVPLLAEHILARETSSAGGRTVTMSPDVVGVLTSYDWPGNVRELQNALQFAFIKCKGDVLELDHLPPSLRRASVVSPAQRRVSQTLTDDAIAAALRETGGNRTKAAELLGVSRATFYRYLSDVER